MQRTDIYTGAYIREWTEQLALEVDQGKRRRAARVLANKLSTATLSWEQLGAIAQALSTSTERG